MTLADRNARGRLRRTFVTPIFAAVIPTRVAPFVPAGRTRRFRRGLGLGSWLWLVGLGVRRDFVRTETFGHVRMWLAKAASRFGFMFAVRGFFRRSRG